MKINVFHMKNTTKDSKIAPTRTQDKIENESIRKINKINKKPTRKIKNKTTTSLNKTYLLFKKPIIKFILR